MKLIPNKLTVLTANEVLRAFRAAFYALVGSYPSNSTLAILTAQSALECARWKSMHCFNFGNMRPPQGWTGGYCQFRCNEKIKGVWVWYDPPSLGSNFLAFDTAAEGAEYYTQKLAQRWPEAWAGALRGDTAAFVHGLKQRGYFTADEAPYLAAVRGLCTEFFDYINRNMVTEPTDANPLEHLPSAEVLKSVASAVLVAPALLVGAKGPAVGRWQGIVGAVVDDSFGPATVAATKAWQFAHGLPVSGFVSEEDLIIAGLIPAKGATNG